MVNVGDIVEFFPKAGIRQVCKISEISGVEFKAEMVEWVSDANEAAEFSGVSTGGSIDKITRALKEAA